LLHIADSRTRLVATPEGEVRMLIDDEDQIIEVTAQRIILTAGKGDPALLDQLDLQPPAMHVRPLHQLLVKHAYPHRSFGHCLGAETTPRLTISSHTSSYRAPVWYLGGNLAERGAQQDAATLIENAQQELADLMP